MVVIKKDLALNSPCNRTGAEIVVKGLMLHSVGCPQPSPEVFARIWKTSQTVGVHAVAGTDYVIQCLPLFPERKRARRGWHGGAGARGSVNNTHLSLELTEPATIKYVGGGKWIETSDGKNTKRHILATYKVAVQLFAKWCKDFNLDPLADGVIISHHEGFMRGIATNHGDVEHLWNKFGLTMKQFRKDVKTEMSGGNIQTVPLTPKDLGENKNNQPVKKMTGSVTVTYKKPDGINIRIAPDINAKIYSVAKKGDKFSVVGISKDEMWYRLSDGNFITTIPSYVSFKATPEQKESTKDTGYYRVARDFSRPATYIGSFKDLGNALDLCKQNSGYKVFDTKGLEVYPMTKNTNKEFKFRVDVVNLRIRKGAGTTYDYYKKSDGTPLYVEKGVHTIVATRDGQGAKQWGLLKEYANKKDGWIALDGIFGSKV